MSRRHADLLAKLVKQRGFGRVLNTVHGNGEKPARH